MAFYRFKTGIVHIRGKRLPDPCSAEILLDGKKAVCMAISGYLCDGPSKDNRSGTCDRPMCNAHAHQVSPNRHLCPACRLKETTALHQRSLFTSIVHP